jgi:GxxExxY protein
MSINHLELKNITDKIIECALKVSGVLGGGFVDKVYERALLYELEKNRFQTEVQYPMNVYYEGIIVGDFVADILVQNCILVEIEAIPTLTENHKQKCLNYLKASELELCLLINFGQLLKVLPPRTNPL